jgi:feruloyl esterase
MKVEIVNQQGELSMKALSRLARAATVLGIAAIFAPGGSIARAEPPARIAPKIQCAEMKDQAIPAAAIGLPTKGAVITSATLTPAVTPPPERPWTSTPEYCDLAGSIAAVDPSAPSILFRISIPTMWNQESWHVGGGGMNGMVPMTANLRVQSSLPTSPSLLAQGYAVFGSDSGHQGGGFGGPGGPGPRSGPPGSTPSSPAAGGRGPGASPGNDWIVNQEAWMNFAYEQLKKTHDTAMQALLMMYGSKAKVSYFAGASQGGREGLEVVTRYPADYDGVYVAVPLAYFSSLLIDPTVKGVSQLTPGSWLSPAKSAAIHDEILRQCDALDGAVDGVINDYVGCQKLVDPSVTKDPFARLRCSGGADMGDNCLSDLQLATLDSFYSPDWPGWGAGMEGRGWLTTPTQPDVNNPSAFNGGIGAAAQKGRIGFSQNFNLLTLDVDKYQKQMRDLSDQLDVREDWSAFVKKGGKVIIVTGASDYISNPRAQMRLYERVVARLGQSAVDKSVRYYVMPNSGHGLSGTSAKGEELPSSWEPETALVSWVEKGTVPPSAITLTGLDRATNQPTNSRLMCRYPNYPRYTGNGAVFVASSYSCVAP